MIPRRFLRDTSGSASTEFALMVPFLVALLFFGSEAGHFVWTQHKLVEAVRDGARYASRLKIDDVCDEENSVLADPELADVILLTRTGQLGSTNAAPVVPGWTDAQVGVTVACESFVSTGIYEALGAPGPVVTVSATNVPYPSLFNALGGLTSGVALNARSSAAVIAL
jgi:Flp pilus assembly protein TadG